MYFHRTIVAVALCLMVAGIASAQTVTRRAVLTWTAPTACAGGAPISNCPVRGYSVQKQQGASWVEIGTTAAAVLTYTESNLALGSHSYRVVATSDNGQSSPSNEVTKVIDVPGAPGSVVVTVTVTVAS
jgi:hypothetical protein